MTSISHRCRDLDGAFPDSGASALKLAQPFGEGSNGRTASATNGSKGKQASPVRRGYVQKKNYRAEGPDYYSSPQELPIFDRKHPGPGYRHFLKQRDIHAFVGMLPDWDELSTGLNAVVLAPGSLQRHGYHLPGVVHICAWRADLWIEYTLRGYERERSMLELLQVPVEVKGPRIIGKWTEPTVKAFQLLDVFLHELGHHYDRMTSESGARASRGEPYAEKYARESAEQIWTSYREVFGIL